MEEEITHNEVDSEPEAIQCSRKHWDLIIQLSEEALIAKLKILPEDMDIKEFKSYFVNSSQVSNINERLEQILAILQKEATIISNEDTRISLIRKSKFFCFLIILLNEQCEESKPWSSTSNAELVIKIENEIDRIICRGNDAYNQKPFGGCQNVTEYIFKTQTFSHLSPQKTILGEILRMFRGKLKKEEWKYHPAAAFSFAKILHNISYPHLSDYMDGLLPPILLFIDDYYDENRLMGMQNLEHVIGNLNKADLLRNNWAEVLYNTMLRCIAEKESLIVVKIYCILRQLLKIIEDPNRDVALMSKYDETLKQILFNMEFSSDTKLRNAWMPHLIEFLEIMGHSTLRWVDKICQMLFDFTTCNDPELWDWILKCVNVCIKITWIKPNSEVFAEIVLRVVFNASVFNIDYRIEDQQISLYSSARDCLLLLKNCEDYSRTNTQLMEILNSDTETKSKLHPQFLHILRTYIFYSEQT